MKRLIVFLIIGTLFISLASANIFNNIINFFKKEEPYKPMFNISNNFNNRQNELKVLPICRKFLNNVMCKNKNYKPLNIRDFDYFYKNNEGILRFIT